MDGGGVHHNQFLLLQQQQKISVNIDQGGGGGGGGGGDRFPQWSVQETRDLLMIRGELDPTFVETKRNKLLWELISTKMKEKGYTRSADQCKCKWKNLVTRYKGCETMEPEGMKQQLPFYNELQAISAARVQRMQWIEAEGGASGSKKKATLSSDDEDENEDSDGDQRANTSTSKKKRKFKGGGVGSGHTGGGGGGNVSGLKEVLDDFMKQQMQMDIEWRKMYEAREEERMMKEMEWRQTMESLETERIMMESRWREREEQRRMREEARAEKRDALITQLLNKLRREDHM